MQKRSRVLGFLAGCAVMAVACAVLAVAAYRVPWVHNQVEYRWVNLRARVIYALDPPEQMIFTPNPTAVAAIQATLEAPTATPTSGPTQTPTITPVPTAVPTPIPSSRELGGVRHEYEHWNNCGPATLGMALSFWGWEGSQNDTAPVLKPNPRDKNVMPYEMEAFVEEHTGLRAAVRMGGDLDVLRRLIAAGFPVLIERGFDVPGKGWMGHYELLAGYDDADELFNAYDSYVYLEGGYFEGHTLPVSYSTVEAYWRHFNNLYIVIYPPQREGEVLALLGADADQAANYQHAAQRASDDIFALTGRDQYFAWFNRGTSLMMLRDYAGAAAAYDSAFSVYQDLDPDDRPWRMLWYQTGPYFAYFYSGRYYDVIDLATTTLDAMDEPVLEESYYWRGMAREALGDLAGAIEDYRSSVEVHPDFGPGMDALERLGATP